MCGLRGTTMCCRRWRTGKPSNHLPPTVGPAAADSLFARRRFVDSHPFQDEAAKWMGAPGKSASQHVRESDASGYVLSALGTKTSTSCLEVETVHRHVVVYFGCDAGCRAGRSEVECNKEPSRVAGLFAAIVHSRYGLTAWMAWLPWGMAASAVGLAPVG
jgi:hypothetical protein